jgi:uncharacterized damage-inducible protein DinB
VNATDLRTLLDYHYWARTRILDAADQLATADFTKDLGSSYPSVRDTLAHIYGAEVVWCSRWHGEAPTALPPASDFPDAATLRRAWSDHELRVRKFFDSLGDDGVHNEIEYRTIAGKAYRQEFSQMLLHVVNHATYHRGQITTMLRQLEAAPPKSMDLVVFFRERAA